MENMENNVVMNEAAAEAADVATSASIGQKALGGIFIVFAVTGAVTLGKMAVDGVKCLIGKVKTFKPSKKPQDIVVEAECEEVTE